MTEEAWKQAEKDGSWRSVKVGKGAVAARMAQRVKNNEIILYNMRTASGY